MPRRRGSSKRRRRKRIKSRYTREVGYRRHTIKRAREKLDINFTDELRTEIIQAIRQNKSKRYVRLTKSRTLHMVICGEKNYYPIYSNTTKEVVTLLDSNHAERLFAVNKK